MANTDRPNGFRPAKSLIGASWNALVRQYDADAAKTNAIGVGDPVTLAADGNVELAVSGNTILGVAVGFGNDATQTFGEGSYFDPRDLETQFMGGQPSWSRSCCSCRGRIV